MGMHDDRSLKDSGPRRLPASAHGPLVTLLAIGAVELLVRAGILNIPNPAALVLIGVVYAGYGGGLRAGMISALLAVLYALFFYSVPGAPLRFEGENATRMAVLPVAAIFLAWLTGTLRDRAERALRAQIAAERAHVAELEQSHAQIARLTERLERALSGSRLVLWELDLRTGMVQLGREWAGIVGGDSVTREIKASDLWQMVHPEDRARVDAEIQAVIERRIEQYDIEHRIRALDGEWKWVRSTGRTIETDADGRPQRLSGTNRDITSRKRAEIALAENDLRLRLVTDAVPALITYVDSKLNYRYCNRRYCGAMSRPESAILGHSVRTVVGEEEYEFARPWLERALAGEQVEYERRHRWPDGAQADLAVTYVPHIGDDGTVLGLYALLVDLTERKRAERIKERFISMVSHELRNPLTSIMLAHEFLMAGRSGGLSEKQAATLALAQQNAERMLHLADEILEIEKIDQGELQMAPRTVALSALVGRALELNQGLADKYGVRIEGAPVPAAEVLVDPDRLQQVLANLISNAAKHSPRGGRVEVSCELRGPLSRIGVSDEGAGVPESFREQLFGRFAQSIDGRKRGGSGLGLAICKEIVERSGGRIGYEPRPGGGSRFWVDLPAATPAQPAGTAG